MSRSGCSGFTFTLVCPECGCRVAEDVVFAPGTPGRFHGPPETCYPPEPGYVEDFPQSCPNCEWEVDEDEVYRQGERSYGEWLERAAEDAALARWEDREDR